MVDLKIERLCTHHEVKRFQAIDDSDRFFAKVLVQRREELEADLPGQHTFVAVRGLRVAGFIDLKILVVIDGEGWQKVYLFIPTVAVDESYRDSTAFGLLIGRITAWHATNDPLRLRFRGVVCAPGTNAALRKMLVRRRFVRWPVRPDDDSFLWRPFHDFKGDD